MKKSKNEVMNLIFSAFLVTAFMVCSSFFLGMINDSFSQNETARILLVSLVFAIFGGLLFYATRVGDGRQVFRFSAATLIIMVLPALFVVLASAVSGMPLHEQLASRGEVTGIAGVILGYGIPYTFLSGYELDRSEGGSDKTADAEAQAASEEAEYDDNDADDAAEASEEAEYDDNDADDAAEASEEAGDI